MVNHIFHNFLYFFSIIIHELSLLTSRACLLYIFEIFLCCNAKHNFLSHSLGSKANWVKRTHPWTSLWFINSFSLLSHLFQSHVKIQVHYHWCLFRDICINRTRDLNVVMENTVRNVMKPNCANN